MEQGASKMNRTGHNELDEGSGHGRQRVTAGTQPAEQGTAGRHSQRILRPAQASKQTNGPQLASLAAKTTAAADDVGLLLAVQCR